jgi:hypothetical protein
LRGINTRFPAFDFWSLGGSQELLCDTSSTPCVTPHPKVEGRKERSFEIEGIEEGNLML